MKKKILMCGSELSVKGGMVSVVKNYLSYNNWDEFEIKYIPTHTDKGRIAAVLYFAAAYIRIVLYAVFGKYDYLYLHTAERGSFYRKAILVRTFRKSRIKTIMHHHAAEFEQFYSQLSDKQKQYVNDTLRYVDLNIVLSNRLVKMITGKAPDANVKVLYNAVSTYKENPYNTKASGVLFLGRLGKRKGIYDLLKVIENINGIISEDIGFYLCGDGEVEEVTQWIKEHGIENRIRHVGWIDDDQKKDILSKTMINVLPSYNEGLPMSILETMAYGIPNISTCIASIPEVISNGVNGFLIKPGDTESLESNIIRLCNNSSLRREISNKSWRDITNKFSIGTHIRELKQFLYDLE